MRELIRFLLGIAMPFILMASGAGLIALSFEFRIGFLLWGGGIVFLGGVIWGIWLVLSSGWSPFD